MSKDVKEILNVHNFRFACKEFREDKRISKEDMELILEVGRLSPSSFGLEPWKFLVIDNQFIKDTIESLSWGLRKKISPLNYLVIILARRKKDMIYSSDYIRYMMETIQEVPKSKIYKRLDRYKNFIEEDFNLLDDEDEMFNWASKQTYIPLANMMTAAAELGIDSCPIEGFNRDRLERELSNLGILDRETFGVSTMVTFGYRSEDPKKEKTRRPTHEVIEWIT